MNVVWFKESQYQTIFMLALVQNNVCPGVRSLVVPVGRGR